MSSVAYYLGQHHIASLLIVCGCMLLVTGVLWRLIDRYAEPFWAVAARWWTRLGNSAIGAWVRRVPFLHRSLTHTLTAWRYLGLHAAASFIVTLFGLGAFIELADGIDEHEGIALFDATLARSLGEHVDRATLELFARITHLGDRDVTIGIGIVVLVYFLIRRWWLHAAVWALTTGLGGLLVKLLKHHFERTRPVHDHALTDSTGWSFPSGHATGAVLIYGMLGYLLIRHTPRAWHIPIALVTVALITVVGFSRVILQVHYLSDVLAGFAVAAAWMALGVTAFEVIRRRGSLKEPTS